MNKILTFELVEQAFNLLRPSISKILENKGCIWGPAWVDIIFSGPQDMMDHMIVGNRTKWDPAWGDELNFSALADAKRILSQREKMSGSEIVLLKPWLLQRGDWLYSGSAYRDGLVCGVSGAKGEVDEMIANLVLETVIGLCILRRSEFQDNGVEQIC